MAFSQAVNSIRRSRVPALRNVVIRRGPMSTNIAPDISAAEALQARMIVERRRRDPAHRNVDDKRRFCAAIARKTGQKPNRSLVRTFRRTGCRAIAQGVQV